MIPLEGKPVAAKPVVVQVGEIVARVIPAGDCHAALYEQVDLLIESDGRFGKLQFPNPRKK